MDKAKRLTGTRFRSYMLLLRPRQWIKNLFLFAPLMFSRNIGKPAYTLTAIYAFLCFCITSSAVYIFNDLMDIEKDKIHPKKSKRPLAAGEVGRREAQALMTIMLSAAVAFSFILNGSFGYIVIAYLANNLLYTVYLKNLVILDVMSIASGFILRVAGGAVVIDVQISPWLLLCTFLLALFLGFSKRRNELQVLQENAQGYRSILEHYSLGFLDSMLSIVTASTLISYSLYAFFASEDSLFMVTIPFVLYGIFRYQYLIYKKNLGESPEEIVLTDKPLLISIILWILASAAVLYM